MNISPHLRLLELERVNKELKKQKWDMIYKNTFMQNIEIPIIDRIKRTPPKVSQTLTFNPKYNSFTSLVELLFWKDIYIDQLKMLVKDNGYIYGVWECRNYDNFSGLHFHLTLFTNNYVQVQKKLYYLTKLGTYKWNKQATTSEWYIYMAKDNRLIENKYKTSNKYESEKKDLSIRYVQIAQMSDIRQMLDV